MKKIIFFLLLLPGIIFSQTAAEKSKIIQQTNTTKLQELSLKYRAEFQRNKEKAIQMSRQKNWQISITDGNTYSELIGVTNDNQPIYYMTYNQGAGITSKANKLYNGGGLGLNIEGQNMLTALWDAGSALPSHEIFSGRVQLMDESHTTRSHSTHVAGTIIGTNEVQGGLATGMAFKANLHSYDWDNDESEVATAAADGLLLSNHSYGYNPYAIQDYQWGKYDLKAQYYDDIMFNAPHYQFVCAAGNSRGNFNLPKNGYDLITGQGASKNGITVGSVGEVQNYTGPNAVVMSATSSWGPTDDGRIKPDIVAKGINTFSSTNISDSSYGLSSGTSMASPSVDGTLLLLQQYYNQVTGSYMRAATLKGLMIHTASEAGSTPGPDYNFGWGLINAEQAATLIAKKGLQSYVFENNLSQGETFAIDVNAMGNEPLIATLCWTDPMGNQHSFNVDDHTPDLVNDLDIRITQSGDTFYPWKLNGLTPTVAATKGDNVVDNVEKAVVENASGNYTISVTHKGTLTNNSQNYSLIVSGIILKNFWFTTTDNPKNVCNNINETSLTFNLNRKGDFNETVNFSALNLPAGITADFTPSSMNTSGTFTLTLDNLSGLTSGSYPFIVKGQSASDVFEMTVVLNLLSSNFNPVTLQQPPNNAVNVTNPVTFRWLVDVNAQQYDIQIATDSNFTNIVETTELLLDNSHTSTLLNDTTYFWRIRNRNQCGIGEYGASQTFKTACFMPANLTIHDVTKTSVSIGWTSNATSWTYLIVPHNVAPSGSGTLTTSNPLSINGLLSNTCYDFYFKNTCATGGLPWSQVFTFCTLPDYCAGDHFYDSGGANGNYSANEEKTTVIYPDVTGQRVRATFNSFLLDDCCDYLIIFNGPSDSSPFLILANGDNSPGSVVSTDPTGALTFVFHSSSTHNEFGWDATINCEAIPPCPNVPSNFQLLNTTTSTAQLKWFDNSDATSWEVEILPHNTVPSGVATATANANPFLATQLLQNTCYDFYIRSLCSNGMSNWAGPFFFCTSADYCGGDHFYDSGGANGDYQNYEYKTTVISPDQVGDRIQAIFNYFDVVNDDSFVVYNGPDSDSPVLFDSQINPNNPGMIASTHSSGALTFVFASDGFHHDRGWDATIICEPLPPCATFPDHIHAENISMNGATIEWDNNADPISWEIELVLQGVSPTGVGTPVNTNSYAFSGLSSNTCYHVYLRSICAANNSVWSNAFTFCTAANYCGGDHFYDSGGANNNYSNNEFNTTVIYPDQAGDRVKAIFDSFNVSSGDRLKIYNGPTRNHPLLFNSGTNGIPTTFVSTHNSGALTFVFTSNDQGTSSGWDATIICEALPQCANVPTSVHVITTSSIAVKLGWNENSGATSWEVKIALHNVAPASSGTVISSNYYLFSDLSPNTCYDLYVRSICPQGNSAWTPPYQFCTEPDYCTGTHFYDSGGISNNYGNNQDKVTTIYPGNSGERVWAIFNSYEFESCCDYFKIYNGPDTSYPLLYNDAALSPGSVASTDVSGALTFEFHSDDSTTASGWDASIICEPMPTCQNPPTNINASGITTSDAVLSWTENAAAISWNIQILPQGLLPGTNGTMVSSSSFAYSGLTSATCYDFYVQSICNTGNTGWSGPYQFCTLPDYCGGDHFYDSGGPNGNYKNLEHSMTVIYPQIAGNFVSATFLSYNVEGCCDILRIYDGPNATCNQLFNGGNSSPGTVISTHATGALAFEFTSDNNATANGWNAVIDCGPLSSYNEQAFGQLEYFPNPVTRLLNVNAHEKVTTYSVYGIDGKHIIQAKVNTERFEIDLQQLSSGSYFVKFSGVNSETKTIKILKQ